MSRLSALGTLMGIFSCVGDAVCARCRSPLFGVVALQDALEAVQVG